MVMSGHFSGANWAPACAHTQPCASTVWKEGGAGVCVWCQTFGYPQGEPQPGSRSECEGNASLMYIGCLGRVGLSFSRLQKLFPAVASLWHYNNISKCFHAPLQPLALPWQSSLTLHPPLSLYSGSTDQRRLVSRNFYFFHFCLSLSMDRSCHCTCMRCCTITKTASPKTSRTPWVYSWLRWSSVAIAASHPTLHTNKICSRP